MNLYINKVWLSGVVRTHPKIRNISEKTKATSFAMAVLETWESPGGEFKSHRNDVPIDVLGKAAESAYRDLSPGDWISVDGYIRSEVFKGKQQIRIRVFSINWDRASRREGANESTGNG